jgi:hypothetical protein
MNTFNEFSLFWKLTETTSRPAGPLLSDLAADVCHQWNTLLA